MIFKKSIVQTVLALFTALLLVSGCQNKDYFIDGGTTSPYYDGTIMDFLRSRPDAFSKLVEIIELAGLEEVLESDDITFFAAPNRTIDVSVNELNNRLYISMGRDKITELGQVSPKVWREFLEMYIFTDRYLLKDIPQLDTTAVHAFPGQAYLSLGGQPMNLGVVYNDYKGIKYSGYRQLLISYVEDFTEMDMINGYVATCDLQPVNGILHGLRSGGHQFGFDYRLFVEKAIAEGIGEPSGSNQP